MRGWKINRTIHIYHNTPFSAYYRIPLLFRSLARLAGNNLTEGSNNIHSKRLQKEVPGLPLGKNP